MIGNLVGLRLLRQREGDARRQRIEERGAGRALALQALVALHALVGGVAGLALLDEQLDAVDAAVALVDQVVVVGHAVGVGHAVHGVGAGTVGQNRHELLVLRRSRRGKRRARKDGSCQYQCVANHFVLLLIGSGLAARSLVCGLHCLLPATAAPRCGLRFSLSRPSSVWVRPESKLFLADRPQPREPTRLGDQKIADQRLRR